MVEKWRCRLFWGNPCTSPPNGMPRTVIAILCDRPHPIPVEITSISGPGSDYAPGTGWAIGWERIDQRPIRRWSQEARARVRQRNLRRKIDKKFPLFAEDFIAEELARRQQYYAGSNDQCP